MSWSVRSCFASIALTMATSQPFESVSPHAFRLLRRLDGLLAGHHQITYAKKEARVLRLWITNMQLENGWAEVNP